MNLKTILTANRNKIIRTDQALLLIIVIIFVTLQLIDLHAEYPTMGWTIQHDEKLIIPDARALYLQGEQKLDDYKEPLSACFGVLGPRLAQSGFSLFGFNNFGLRFFFTVISGVAVLLFSLTLLRMIPGVGGLLLVLLYILNYNYFIQTRYAILENILVLFIIALMWVYLSYRNFFLNHVNHMIFVCGSLILIKQNFPFYCYLLIGTLAIVERFTIKKILKLVFWSLAGLILFGVLNALLLYQVGLLDLYIKNLFMTFYAHGGNYGNFPTTQRFYIPKPINALLVIIPYFLKMFWEWCFFPLKNVDSNLLFVNDQFLLILFLYLSFFILFICFWLHQKKRASRITIALFVFLTIILLLSSQMYFYLKRALPFIPLTIIFFVSIYRDVIRCIESDLRKKYVRIGVMGLIVLLFGYRTIFQVNYLNQLSSPATTFGVKENSEKLDEDIPGEATVYMHCYALRFFWQTRHRIISGDDQLMNNQLVLEKALNENGKYVLLSKRSRPIVASETYRFKPEDSKNNGEYFIMEKREKKSEEKIEKYIIKPLMIYHTTERESGIPDSYVLFQITTSDAAI